MLPPSGIATYPRRGIGTGALAGLRFAALYALSVAAAIVAGALILGGAIEEMWLLIGLFTIGAFGGGLFARLAVSLLGRRMVPTARVALAILALMLFTTACQHVAYFVNYMSYYAAWWPAPFTPDWLRASVSTYAGSGFYFTALGLPLMLPVGLPVLLVAAFLLARRPH